MSAASARAIASHQDAAIADGLERAVAWSRQWSAEFPFCLANHLPMVLVALHRMGASDERLEAYCHIYHEQNGLVPVPHAIGADHARQLARVLLASASARATIAPSSPARSRGLARRRRPALPAAAHSRHRGERHARVHAHGLCDDDRQRRGDRRRARLLGRDLSVARRLARRTALDRRSGRGARLHA